MVFIGNFYITIQNTKDYLKTEMTVKAKDTATSLGMILKSFINDKSDPEIELTINAISDSGFYKEIRLEDISYRINKDIVAKSLSMNKEDFQIKRIYIDDKIGTIQNDDSEDLANGIEWVFDNLEKVQCNSEIKNNFILEKIIEAQPFPIPLIKSVLIPTPYFNTTIQFEKDSFKIPDALLKQNNIEFNNEIKFNIPEIDLIELNQFTNTEIENQVRPQNLFNKLFNKVLK